MNKARRKELLRLKERIEELQSEVYDIITDLQCEAQDEQDYMDNMPENLQGSELYEKAEHAIENMYEAVEILEGIADELSDAASSLETATE